MDQSKRGQPLNVSVGLSIEQETMKNLLSAHKRIADSGNASEIIRQPKYLFRLAQKKKQELIQVFPEDNLNRRKEKMHWRLYKENLGDEIISHITFVFSD